jgi:hypothetical protein
MKKNLFLIVMMVWSCGVLFGQDSWVKTFGGSESDVGNSIISTSDGGCVLTGSTYSYDGDFMGMNKGGKDIFDARKSRMVNGGIDIFVIKLDSRGEIQWKKMFGGSSGEDRGFSITTTPDSGYVLTGSTNSNDGDFKGMNKGESDIFVIKLDSRGNIQWKKTIGGSDSEQGFSITTTPDDGYVLTGQTDSRYDGDFKGMQFEGLQDICVIKLDSRGDLLWRKLYGSNGTDEGKSITITSDGGYVITGNEDGFGLNNIFVIKLDSNGVLQWKKKLGRGSDDYGPSITTSPDGGYVLTGETNSDIFVLKLNSRGEIQWNKRLDGNGDDGGTSITRTKDEGYILTGYSVSNDGDFIGMDDAIVVIKLDSQGNIRWKKGFGGKDWDGGASISMTANGEYLLTGTTLSNDGDFKGMNKGGREDIFVIKLDSNGNLQPKGKKSKKK